MNTVKVGLASGLAHSLIATQSKIIKKEIFQTSAPIGGKILILKNVNAIPKYTLDELSF